jgi:aspartate-semialdehyde dehydrogenase
LNSSKEMVENFQRAVIKNRDYSNQIEVQKKLAEDLKPISETMKTEDQKLDEEIKKILSEKQYQKWLKFNKSLNKTFSEEK